METIKLILIVNNKFKLEKRIKYNDLKETIETWKRNYALQWHQYEFYIQVKSKMQYF